MNKLISAVVAGTMALGSVAVFGVATASASTTTPTITLTDPKAIFDNGPVTIVATASVAGTVDFTLAGTTITGCGAVATATATPFLATCSWTPAAAGATTLGATFAPSDTTDYTAATATAIAEAVASPVQGLTTSPVSLYVDTILASGSTGALAPKFGTGCEITNEFIVGQTIVFRVYGNDAALGGVPLTSQNVSSATVTVGGVATPLALAYGNHSGAAFWTVPLKTGSTAGLYSTLGVISYTVTVNTVAVPAVTKSERFTKIVTSRVNGKLVSKRVAYNKTVVVTPAVAGAVGTFTSGFTASSVATLNALPAS